MGRSISGRTLAQEMFGDILPVRRTMNGLYAVPTQDVVHLMGMENMCFHWQTIRRNSGK